MGGHQSPRLIARGAVLMGLAALAGCSGRERSADYFAAHEAEAKDLLGKCAAGTARGPECRSAFDGLRSANGARAYKKSDFPVTGGKSY